MTRPIIDAGPGLNFFSLNKERLLIAALGALATPEAVWDEIARKARRDRRFEAAGRALNKLNENYLKILSDDATEPLERAVRRICNQSLGERKRTSKDFGETMVVAHASVMAENGDDVYVLIDERQGSLLAAREDRRLQRLQANGLEVGQIRLVHSTTVLSRMAGTEHIPDRGEMRKLYMRMRELDDGLEPLENTNLMKLPCWKS